MRKLNILSTIMLCVLISCSTQKGATSSEFSDEVSYKESAISTKEGKDNIDWKQSRIDEIRREILNKTAKLKALSLKKEQSQTDQQDTLAKFELEDEILFLEAEMFDLRGEIFIDENL